MTAVVIGGVGFGRSFFCLKCFVCCVATVTRMY